MYKCFVLYFQDCAFTETIEHLSDTVVKLEAFAGSDKEQNPAYKEYHGASFHQLLTIHKLLITYFYILNYFTSAFHTKKPNSLHLMYRGKT